MGACGREDAQVFVANRARCNSTSVAEAAAAAAAAAAATAAAAASAAAVAESAKGIVEGHRADDAGNPAQHLAVSFRFF